MSNSLEEGKGTRNNETKEEGCGIMNSATEIFVPLLSIFVGTLIASHCRYFSPTAPYLVDPFIAY